MKDMYQVDTLKKISCLIIIVFIISCNSNNSKQEKTKKIKTLNNKTISDNNIKPIQNIDTCIEINKCYSEYDSQKVNSKDEIEKIITILQNNNNDVKSIAILLQAIQNIKNESKSEEIGYQLFTLINKKSKMNSTLSTVLNCLPKKQAEKCEKKIILLMNIDLISNEFTENMFKNNFPVFNNEIGIKTFKSIIKNADAGEK